jgi:23S rRNA pseudouridine1911/1915/1917 synthase
MAVVPGGRAALSLFTVRRQYDAFALVDVELKTGRTHQIRVHLSWLKHPVVGDHLYGGGRENSLQNPQLRAQVRKLTRQFLHAEELGFSHPATGKPLRLFSPLPPELSGFLESLKART